MPQICSIFLSVGALIYLSVLIPKMNCHFKFINTFHIKLFLVGEDTCQQGKFDFILMYLIFHLGLIVSPNASFLPVHRQQIMQFPLIKKKSHPFRDSSILITHFFYFSSFTGGTLSMMSSPLIFARIFFSISSARPGLSRIKSFTVSRPCPNLLLS